MISVFWHYFWITLKVIKKVLSSDKKQNIIHHSITIESIGFCLEGFYKHNANRMVRKKTKQFLITQCQIEKKKSP